MALHTICLVGNPNAGKTTIFNGLTGARRRVGNWAGVTVEYTEGRLPDPDSGIELSVIDLPGLYSLHATSDDERVARDALMTGDVDLVVNVVDATNLERNLYLTSQLLELGIPMMVVLSMHDLAERSGIAIDEDRLSVHLGVPVVAVDGTSERDQRRLRRAVRAQTVNPVSAPRLVRYAEVVESIVEEWAAAIDAGVRRLPVSPRWLAIQILDGDRDAVTIGKAVLSPERVGDDRRKLEERLGEEIDIVIADSRFGFVHGITSDVVRARTNGVTLTERIDRFVLHPLLGIPVFFVIMYAVFWVTIALGGAAIDFFDILAGSVFVEGTRAVLQWVAAPSWLELLIADGIGAGMQTVATFVPIIFAMFLMLSLLENSGYMARAAFVMDRVMRRIGLPGKSFVPLLVGFGCTVPAIISTRTLESRKDRLMTVFIAPLMSCGARLPVYALFAAAFFPRAAGAVVFSLYLAGIAVAVGTGLLLKHTLFPGEASHLVMELPPYHRPQVRATPIYTWTRMKSFVVNAGTTIAVAVAVLAVLNAVQWPGTEDSVLARAGKAATPVLGSIGIEEDNWPATVGLFTGLFAKEAIVGTLNSLYLQVERGAGQGAVANDGPHIDGEEVSLEPASAGAVLPDPAPSARPIREWFAAQPAVAGEAAVSLWSGLRAPGFGLSGDHGSGSGDIGRLRSHFTPAGAYAYLLFVLLYLPCLAAFGAAVRELGRRYGTLLAIYLTGVAWSASSLFYQIAEGRDAGYITAALAVVAVLVIMFVVAGRRDLELRVTSGVPETRT
jgi:ferrous iron transport protein B